ncbi:hypothetical protein GCM10009605_39690 [Nocardiopsis composta]
MTVLEAHTPVAISATPSTAAVGTIQMRFRRGAGPIGGCAYPGPAGWGTGAPGCCGPGGRQYGWPGGSGWDIGPPDKRDYL